METNNKIPATVRILTLQASKTLRRCLESVKDFAEILVVDGNSTDDTVKIAKEYGARVEKQFPDRNEPNILIEDWPAMVNRVVQMASYDWILHLDADEAIPPELVQEIREVVSNPQIEHYIYQVPNRVIYKGRLIKYAISYPGYQDRFFSRKSGGKYVGGTHYYLTYDEQKYSLGTFKNPWYVFVDNDDISFKPYFVITTAMGDKDQNWWQFLRWSIFNKFFGIVKIIIKAIYMYTRHGFKDSIPPRFVLAKIIEKLALIWYLVKQRFAGPLKLPTEVPRQYLSPDK